MKQAAAQPRDTRDSFVVTASHDAVLQAVYKFQLLTSAQLVNACGYSPNSLARVQRLTKQLVDNEYLLWLPVPVVRGKAPLVYTLARKGLNYLKRVLKRTPYKVTIWQGEKQEAVTVIPDAFLLFAKHLRNGRKQSIPILLELDRSTTEQRHFRRNLRARIAFIKQEGHKTLLGTHTATFAYAIAVGSVKRREELRSWARKEFAATSEQRWLSNLFLFTDLPQMLEPHTLFLTPRWFTPFGDTPRSLLIQ
jgi:hypothetical protein